MFKKAFLVGTAIAVGIPAAGLIAGYFLQDKLLYHPKVPGLNHKTSENPAGYQSPSDQDIDFEERYISTPDGERLHAWLMRPSAVASSTVPTIVFFHGNAGNMGYRLPNMRALIDNVGANILSVDYRGYGESSGWPSEQGLITDGMTTLQYLIDHSEELHIDSNKIILYGRSLGGAVAAQVAHRAPDKVCALILENTFTSVPAMVDTLFPLLRRIKHWVLRIGWDTKTVIRQLPMPILFLAAEQDELVPPAHMRELRKAAKSSSSTEFVLVPGAHHNDIWMAAGVDYWRQMRGFVLRHGSHIRRALKV